MIPIGKHISNPRISLQIFGIHTPSCRGSKSPCVKLGSALAFFPLDILVPIPAFPRINDTTIFIFFLS